MEFTVSKTDLVRELNLSQGVVEKKTTIPILSNVLLDNHTGLGDEPQNRAWNSSQSDKRTPGGSSPSLVNAGSTTSRHQLIGCLRINRPGGDFEETAK